MNASKDKLKGGKKHINKWVFVHYIICTIINGIQKYLGNDKQNSLISKAKEVYNLGPWSSVPYNKDYYCKIRFVKKY